jgi:cyclic pyranopterin phosphate synthase
MSKPDHILTDQFGREHTYLRISLIERCNLRCTYCMPAEGVPLMPRSHLMSYEEIFTLASLFVKHGVNKIRLTGGEPLIRKDIPVILEKLSGLPASLSITTNAVTVERHIDTLKQYGVQHINVSLDSLKRDKFKRISLRDDFDKVNDNLQLLLRYGFKVKLNMVVMKGVNDDEIIDFIELSRQHPLSVRFIEFMPFDGNNWNIEKTVSYESLMQTIRAHYGTDKVIKIEDAPNDTSRNYRIDGYPGSWAVISTVSNPFCDTCNRLRLTANGRLKNCLFSQGETDLLSPLREGRDIEPLIQKAVLAKKSMRGGMDSPEKFEEPKNHGQNRSMIRIGG